MPHYPEPDFKTAASFKGMEDAFSAATMAAKKPAVMLDV
jgi:hypothetical protein